MDLLGSYSSSGDDDSSSSASERSKSPPTPIVIKTSLHRAGLAPAMPSPQRLPAIKLQGKSSGLACGRRRKKLISLHSVLPPHILEGLSKSETAGDLDSSDDEVDENSSTKVDSSKDYTFEEAASKDEGIANFLSALGSAKTNAILKANNQIQDEKPRKGKLEAALMLAPTRATAMSGAQGSSEVTDPRGTPTEEASNGSPSHYKPLSLSPRTAFLPFPTSAAPRPPTHAPAAPPSARATRLNQYSDSLRQEVAPPLPAPTFTGTLDTSANAGGGSRSKKRQLAKALRAGNLDQALGDSKGVTKLDQAMPTAFVPEPETYAVPANGVRVVATQMYNPRAGKDVQTNLGAVRARGKNQINQLMASAANFELQQARSGHKTNNQRTGAKRKYGW